MRKRNRHQACCSYEKVQSFRDYVGMHGGHEDTFLLCPPCCLPSGGEAPGSNFLDNSPDIGQGQGQVTAHDLAWKLQ